MLMVTRICWDSAHDPPTVLTRLRILEWSSVPTGKQVDARMTLKRLEAPPAGAGGEPGIADEAA